ncbi:hypothetical protein J6590_010756 [Homalodisca vitripennis]|nr:hypothetical protein J6590_010756 [Homalodisca vitripennis]
MQEKVGNNPPVTDAGIHLCHEQLSNNPHPVDPAVQVHPQSQPAVNERSISDYPALVQVHCILGHSQLLTNDLSPTTLLSYKYIAYSVTSSC